MLKRVNFQWCQTLVCQNDKPAEDDKTVCGNVHCNKTITVKRKTTEDDHCCEAFGVNVV